MLFWKGDHDPPSAVREGAGDRCQSACQVCSCLGEFWIEHVIRFYHVFCCFCVLASLINVIMFTCYDSGDHGSESHPWKNQHNRASPPSLPLTIERRMSWGKYNWRVFNEDCYLNSVVNIESFPQTFCVSGPVEYHLQPRLCKWGEGSYQHFDFVSQ